MTSNILYIVLFIILIKPIFVFFSYIISVIYFYFYKKETAEMTSSKEVCKRTNIFKKFAKYIFGGYVAGFVFYSILQTGKIPFHTARNFIYRYFYRARLGENVIIYSGAEMRSPDRLIIGKGSIIGHYSILDARNFIEIGENVNFSHGVWLWTEQHNHNDPDFGTESAKKKKITICNRVWLGPRVIVLPGCTIGEGAVVGAGSVVTKDIVPFSINAGIPAKKIGERNRNINYVFNDKPLPFI
jgi:acetyltransferase-like isoleucine patch superfamily enzyme